MTQENLLRKSWIVWIPVAFLGLTLLGSLLGDRLAPFDYRSQDLLNRFQPPALFGDGGRHVLGTDDLGRDVLSLMLQAIRISMLTAFAGGIISALSGTLAGLIAAHFGGFADDGLMILVDFQGALPFMILALLTQAFFGSSLVVLVALLGTYGWERYARLTRGLVCAVRGRGHFESLQSLGFHPVRIYLRHVLPIIAAPLLVQLTLNFANIILVESGLSFLGLGIQPPLTSLGLMIARGRQFLLTAWWLALIPGVQIVLTTLSVGLIGDWFAERRDRRGNYL